MRRETTALLLPAASAYLHQALPSDGVGLAESMRDRLLAFVAAGSSAEGRCHSRLHNSEYRDHENAFLDTTALRCG